MHWRYVIIAELEGSAPIERRSLAFDGGARAADLAMCLMAGFGLPPYAGFEFEIDGLVWIPDDENSICVLDPRMPLSKVMGMLSTGSIRFVDGPVVTFSVEEITDRQSPAGLPICIDGEGSAFNSDKVSTVWLEPDFSEIFEACHMGGAPLSDDELRESYEHLAADIAGRLLTDEYASKYGGCVRNTYDRLSSVFGEQSAWEMVVACLGEMLLRCDMENAMKRNPDEDGLVSPMDPDDISADEYIDAMDSLTEKMLGTQHS